jgi:F-type H+-transporting ATPase subunit alpha
MDKIDESGDYSAEIEQALNDALKDFKANHTW